MGIVWKFSGWLEIFSECIIHVALEILCVMWQTLPLLPITATLSKSNTFRKTRVKKSLCFDNWNNDGDNVLNERCHLQPLQMQAFCQCFSISEKKIERKKWKKKWSIFGWLFVDSSKYQRHANMSITWGENGFPPSVDVVTLNTSTCRLTCQCVERCWCRNLILQDSPNSHQFSRIRRDRYQPGIPNLSQNQNSRIERIECILCTFRIQLTAILRKSPNALRKRILMDFSCGLNVGFKGRRLVVGSYQVGVGLDHQTCIIGCSQPVDRELVDANLGSAPTDPGHFLSTPVLLVDFHPGPI